MLQPALSGLIGATCPIKTHKENYLLADGLSLPVHAFDSAPWYYVASFQDPAFPPPEMNPGEEGEKIKNYT